MKPRIIYDKVCIFCNANYQANRKDSNYCSSSCRVKYNSRKNITGEIKQSGGLISEQQKEVIKISNETIKETVNKEIKTVSNIVGRDLSECKRPDGKHLYTETDLWICLAKIIRCVFQHDKNNPITILAGEQPDSIMADFERRFECKFSDVKKANPNIKPADTDFMNSYIMSQYANLKYSK